MTPQATIAAAQAKTKRESLEAEMALHLRAEGIAFVRELQFHETRKFRFDFAIVPAKLAIEVQGGTWTKGAHSSGSGLERDTEKLAHAVLSGWRVLQVTSTQIRSGKAIAWVKQALESC